MSTAQRVFRWLPAAAWAAVIFGMSSVPGSSIPGRFSYLGHIVQYGVLGAALVWALIPGRGGIGIVALAAAIASAYGITDEFHQAFVPFRTPDPLDWLVDTVAAAAGALIAYKALQRGAASTGGEVPPVPDQDQ